MINVVLAIRGGAIGEHVPDWAHTATRAAKGACALYGFHGAYADRSGTQSAVKMPGMQKYGNITLKRGVMSSAGRGNFKQMGLGIHSTHDVYLIAGPGTLRPGTVWRLGKCIVTSYSTHVPVDDEPPIGEITLNYEEADLAGDQITVNWSAIP